MAIRTYKVILDSKNSIAPEPVYFRQGDKTGALTIDASVTDNGIPVSLDGLTPTFRANTADGKAVIVDGSNFTITDAVNGRFTYLVPNALGAEPGKVKNAYFTFSDADGVESTFGLVFIIQPSVDMTQEQAKDYITIVDGIFKDYQSKLSSTYNSYKSQTDSVFKSFQDQVSSTFNNFQNQVKTSTDNMNNEFKQLSDKTDGLNTNIQQALENFNQGDFYNKAQTDDKDAATLASAKSYADSGDSATLTSAKNYADAQDATLTQALSEFYLKNTGIGFGNGSDTPTYTSDSDIALSGFFSIPSLSSSFSSPVKAKDTQTLLIQKNGYYNISFNACTGFPNNHNWGAYCTVMLFINGEASGGTRAYGIDNGMVALNAVRSLNSGDTIKFKSYVNTSKGVVLYAPHGSVKYLSGK